MRRREVVEREATDILRACVLVVLRDRPSDVFRVDFCCTEAAAFPIFPILNTKTQNTEGGSNCRPPKQDLLPFFVACLWFYLRSEQSAPVHAATSALESNSDSRRV